MSVLTPVQGVPGLLLIILISSFSESELLRYSFYVAITVGMAIFVVSANTLTTTLLLINFNLVEIEKVSSGTEPT
jgi:hypothetical protein